MKIIFLDIDGVLNTSTNGDDAFGDIYNNSFVENLKILVDKTGAKIVCSSSWRHMVRKIFEGRQYDLEIYDITPDFSLYEETRNQPNIRGREIAYWLEGKKIEKYVILDDRNDFLPTQLSNWVNTSDNYYHDDSVDGVGFTKLCLEKAIRLLI